MAFIIHLRSVITCVATVTIFLVVIFSTTHLSSPNIPLELPKNIGHDDTNKNERLRIGDVDDDDDEYDFVPRFGYYKKLHQKQNQTSTSICSTNHSHSETTNTYDRNYKHSKWRIQWSPLSMLIHRTARLKQHDLSLIKSSIHWLDPDFQGQCRSYLYPHVAFLGKQDIKHLINKRDQIESMMMQDVYDSNTIDVNNIFKMVNTTNCIHSNDDIITLTRRSDKLYSFFDTNTIRNDLKRVNFLQNDFTSMLQFSSVVIFADPINVIEYDYYKKMNQLNIFLNDKEMYIEICVVIRKMGWHTQEKMFHKTNSFLCVFNDGTTIFAKQRKQILHGILIQCDITNQIKLKSKLYTTAYNRHKMKTDGSINSGNINIDINIKDDTFVTDIGLTMFAMTHEMSVDEIMHQFMVSSYVQLPVCDHIQINRKPKIYQSEMDYHFNDNNINSSWHSSILFFHENNYQNTSKSIEQQIPNYLSGVTVIHPSRRSGQQDIITLQWIDYHLFQGFDHFYLYDHTHNRNQQNIAYFYDLFANNNVGNEYATNGVKNYFDSGYVTLIEWHFPHVSGQRVWYFEEAAYFESYRRFGYSTQYMYTGDCDEFIIPKPVIPINAGLMNTNISYGSLNNNSNSNGVGFGYDYHFTDIIYPTIDETQMNTVKQLWQELTQKTSYNAYEIFTYAGLPHIYQYLITEDHSQFEQELGCDITNKRQRYDTILERHSCLHYKQTKDLSQLQTLAKHMHDNNNVPFDYSEERANEILDCLTEDEEAHGRYEVTPKMILEAKSVMTASYHFSRRVSSRKTRSDNSKYRKINAKIHPQNEDEYRKIMSRDIDVGKQYEMFVLHARDHWKNINYGQTQQVQKQRSRRSLMGKVFDFSNSQDMKYFYSLTQDKCDHENIILYWNDRFLNSTFGKKWKYIYPLSIDPIVDKDGLFCYLKNVYN